MNWKCIYANKSEKGNMTYIFAEAGKVWETKTTSTGQVVEVLNAKALNERAAWIRVKQPLEGCAVGLPMPPTLKLSDSVTVREDGREIIELEIA